MYLPSYHALSDPRAATDLIVAQPLGAWVCHTRDGLVANHLPWFFDAAHGPHGTLVGHVSRANNVWQLLDASMPSVVMFQGPHAYITPRWYPGRAAHGRVVPTWDYLAVHAHGVAQVRDDREWLRSMLARLTQAQELAHATQQTPAWSMDEAPNDYIEGLLGSIVGIEMPIDRLEGKLKASQDEDLQDRLGTVHGLRSSSGETARAMGALVHGAIAPPPPESTAQ